MKKQMVILCLACLTIIAILFFIFWGEGIRTTPKIEATSALVINTKSEEPIFKKGENEVVPIASLTKLMTAYLVLEAVHKKTISWSEVLPLKRLDDPRAVSLYAQTGTKYYTVQDLFAAMLIMSANDAAEALAERIDGTNFIKNMNAKAKAIGMSSETKYGSASGLDEAGETSVSTANDLLTLSKRLIQDFPEVLDITSRTEYVIQKGSTIHTTNQVLAKGSVDGMDGLKTGFTDQAGYCLIATAVQNGERVIVITLGSKTDGARAKAVEKLMDYGFSK